MFSLYLKTVLPQKSAIFNSDEWVSIVNTIISNGNPSPPKPSIYAGQENQAEIYIGVSSYRDGRCPTTLNNIFSKAKYPERIRIGLVEQVHTEEDSFPQNDCITNFCRSQPNGCKFKSQIDTVVCTSTCKLPQ